MYSFHNGDDIAKLPIDRNKISTPSKKIEKETLEARLSLRYGRSL